jgi:hypothetical protein
VQVGGRGEVGGVMARRVGGEEELRVRLML